MSINEHKSDFEKALMLLPWYAKHELSLDETSWVKQQLTSSDQAEQLQEELSLINKQIGLTERYVESLDTGLYENQPSRINALKNRMKVQNNIQHETQKNLESVSKTTKRESGMWDKIKSYLPRTHKQWQMTTAFSLAVMIIQGVIIAQLSRPNAQVEYTTLSGVESESSGIVLIANFKSGTSMAEMELFLSKNNLRIIDGPDLENQYKLGLKQSVMSSRLLDEEEVSDWIFDLLDNRVVDFIIREN